MYNFNDEYFFVKEETTNALKELEELLIKVSYFTDEELRILDCLNRGKDPTLYDNKELLTQGLRQCSRCGEVKELSEFYKKKHGYHTVCKRCYYHDPDEELTFTTMTNTELKRYGLKRCKECGVIKPLTKFYRNGASYKARCTKCDNKLRNIFYHKAKLENIDVKQAN